MLDNTFQRRKEIERMLLAGKKLTVPELMQMFGVGKKAIRRDFEIMVNTARECGKEYQ